MIDDLVAPLVAPIYLSDEKINEINEAGGLDMQPGEQIKLTMPLYSPDTSWTVNDEHINDAFTYHWRMYLKDFQQFTINASDVATSGLFEL